MILPFSSPSTIGYIPHVKMTCWRFQNLNLDKAGVDMLSMDDLVIKLRERQVVKTATHLVRILSQDSSVEGSASPVFLDPTSCKICVINPKVFLAAIMISYKPATCLDPINGDLQLAVLKSSLEITSFVETSISSFLSDSPVVPGGFLPFAAQFKTDFQAWKLVDEARLTVRIKNALTNMYTSGISLNPTDENGVRLLAAMETQVRRLRAKLVQLNNAAELANFDHELHLSGITVHRVLGLLPVL
jgi:hypothetical protein